MKMDLTLVNPESWLPFGRPITHYKSLIWTERYLTHSELLLTTLNIRETIKALPVGALVTIRGSKEVMMIEKHVIETDQNRRETLKIYGKSLTSYTNHRVVGEKRGVKVATAMQHSNLAAALRILFNSFVGTGAWDYTMNQAASYKNPLDVIPNTVITDSTGETFLGGDGADIQQYLETGPVDPIIKNLLGERPYGLRILRPPNSTYKITVDQPGAFVSALTNNMPQLAFDIFKGVDRSYGQTAVAPVVFDTDIDDLMLPSYVETIETLKTTAHIALDDKAIFAFGPQSPSTVAGLNRRVLYQDGGQAETGYTPADWETYNIKRAQSELNTKVRMYLIDGEVSPQSRFKFGVHYFLGDMVSVRGKYGPVAKAQVMEYIRADNEKGSEAYPSLVYV